MNMVIALFLGWLSTRPLEQIYLYGAAPDKGKKSMQSFLLIVMLVLLMIFSGFFYIHKLPWVVFSFSEIFIVIGLWKEWVSVEIFNLTIFIVLYVASISVSALSMHDLILGSTISENIFFHFKESMNEKNGNYSLITATSEYFFLYNRKDAVIQVIPKNDISSLEYSKLVTKK